jgi:glycogen synthase
MTGGLADTVFDMDDQSNHDRANGYSIFVYLFIY